MFARVGFERGRRGQSLRAQRSRQACLSCIAFETDGLTGFPKIDSSGQDAYGFAVGIENLFDLSRQVVFEFATVQPFGGQSETILGDQYALSARYQHNLNDRWILRADAMIGILDNADNLSGIRLEIRRKF